MGSKSSRRIGREARLKSSIKREKGKEKAEKGKGDPVGCEV